MRILVTGVAGFIGSNLAEALLQRGDTVVGLDNFNDYYSPARKRANAASLAAYPTFTLCEADLRDEDAVKRILAEGRFDAVAHLGAMANVRYSIERAPLYTDVNIRGTVNVLEGMRLAGTPHIVFASTSSVYGKTTQIPFVETDPLGQPLAPYPASKIAGELMGYTYHNLFGISFTAVRFFSVYGPRGRPDMMPYIITDSIVHDKTFKLYDAGEMWRDWTYVGDIVKGVVAALETPLGYERVNLGRGEPVRMADFVALVERLVGKPARMDTPPAPASEPPVTYADITKARTLLGYDPHVSVEEGMTRFWAWYKAEVLQ
ncbi:MAG TPA: GDP-mannose 4,6-dehydratase [Anaerolineae bacterium]|nr:GDP-mannose 4,6-dehydratase [Anaerolineae bacterium]HQK13034.1 GDP-mannose 4,6-dehydratase [Anaerolineae bacterium]